MAYNGGKEISNSFNLEFNNLSEHEQTITLFELGNTSKNGAPTKNEAVEVDASIYIPFFTLASTPPTQYSDIEMKVPSTIATLANVNGNLSVSNPVFPNNIKGVESIINATMNADANFAGIQMSFVFDFNNWKSNNPFPLTMFFFYDTTKMLTPLSDYYIKKLTIANGIDSEFVDNMQNEPRNDVYLTNGDVVITDRGSVSYGEILESQNGQVLDLKNLSILVSEKSTSISTSQSAQLFNCLSFTKRDINGNKVESSNCPVIDVFSNPSINTINDIKLERTPDKYTLDGNTKFNYTINSGNVVQLGAEYTKLTNLLQESEKGKEQILVEKKNIQNNRLDTDYALEKVVVAEEQKGNLSIDVKKKALFSTTISLCLEELQHYY